MILDRFRILAAIAAAFVIGVPLTPKASAQVFDIIFGSLDLAGAIADSSDGS